MDELRDEIKLNFKKWRQKNTNLQSKYENISLWIKMFSKVTGQLKDEFMNHSMQTKTNSEMINEFLAL